MKRFAPFSKPLGIIYGIALLAGSAVGALIPTASAHMSREGLSDAWIGFLSSAFFLLMALGSVRAERIMAGRDVSFGVMAGLLVTASCAAVFPFVHDRWIWLVLMSLMGTGIGFNMVGVQTALHRFSTEQSRSANSGIYSLLFAVGFIAASSAGPAVYARIHWIVFSFGAGCLVLAALLVRLRLKDRLVLEAAPRRTASGRIRIPLFGAFLYGFSETTVISLYPVFLLNEGFEVGRIGLALGVFALGCVAGTVPVTVLADRLGRRRLLAGSVAVSILALLGIMASEPFWLVAVFSFLAGFVVGPVYPLTMSLVPDGLRDEEIASGMAMFTLFYGLGSAAGPFLSSVAMSLFGNRHLFLLSLILSVLFLVQMLAAGKRERMGVHSAAR